MLQLNSNYKLEADSNGFTLTYEKEGKEISEKTGKPVLTRKIMYHPNLELALECFVKHSVLMKCSTDNITLDEVLSQIKILRSIIIDACKDLALKKETFNKVATTILE